MKDINLREILKEYLDCDRSITSIEYAMREACNQTIELCAKEAEVGLENNKKYGEIVCVDKDSILKVKEAIK